MAEKIQDLNKYVDWKEIPKNVVAEGEVIDIEVGDEKEYFKKYEGEGLRRVIKVVVKVEMYNDFINEFLTFYEVATEKTKLGRWRKKYGSFPKIGQKVKVSYDVEGNGKVIL